MEYKLYFGVCWALLCKKWLQASDFLSLLMSWNWMCIVATTLVALRWMCDSPRKGCVWRTTPIYMWCKQSTIEWSQRVISIVACCHSVKLCALVARAFRSQQNGAVTMTWRSCQVQPSQKEHVIGAVCCEKEGMLLQPFGWHCVESVI